MKMKPAIALVVFASLAGCDERGESWTAYAYPNRNDLTQHVERGNMDTLEQCREQAANLLHEAGAAMTGTYECGQGCRYDPEMDINICRQTVK